MVEESMDRAAPDGIGDVKAGGNYAAGLRASKKAHDNGFNEVLYLDAKHKKYIDESGPANFFAISYDGKYITPKSDSILASITNDSLMILAEDMGIEVQKRKVSIDELATFKEAGCCGTAAVIAPVESITYREQTFLYTENQQVGPTSLKLYNRLTGIQNGTVEDKFGWTKKIKLD